MPTTPVSYVRRPYVRSGALGDILRLRGQQEADAILRGGEIQARMWSDLGQNISNAITGVMREREEAPRRAMEDRARALTVADAEAQFAARKKASEDASILASAQSMDLDPDAIEGQLKQLGRGDLASAFRKSWTESETAAATLRAKREEAAGAEADYFGALAAGVKPYLRDPDGGMGAVRLALQKAKRDGFEDADQWLKRVEQNPAQLPQMVDALLQASPTQRKLLGEEADRALKTKQEERALAEAQRTAADREVDNARQAAQAEETARHNRAMERINTMQAGRAVAAQEETARHNRAVEEAARNQKVTGAQRKVLGFFNRMLDAERNARAVEESVGGRDFAAEYLPGEWLENFARSDAGQKYTQAQRTFTEGRLRKESGAAIPTDEYEKDRSTNFKRPNDNDQTVAQKRASRLALLRGAANEAGRALQEFYGEGTTIDDILSEFADASRGSGVTVNMRAPDGRPLQVPAEQVEEARRRGATVVGQ